MALQRNAKGEQLVRQIVGMGLSQVGTVAMMTGNPKLMMDLAEANMRLQSNWGTLLDIILGPSTRKTASPKKAKGKVQ